MTAQRLKLAIGAACVVIVGVLAVYLTSSPQQQTQRGRLRTGADGPVPVLIAVARKQDVPVYLDGVGTAKALNTVIVRPQVDGKLISVNFKEGQDVPKGFLLARIDPATYQAQYDQALAKKAQDEAQLANARIDLERYRRLADTNAGSRQQADTQAATVAQLEAQVKLDQAAIENAKAILDYTTIVAPIAGRTGIRQVDEGNIVNTSDTAGIVTITQIKPISVLFSMPQQEVSRINRAFAKGPLAVEAIDGGNRGVIDRGTLQVVDNQVDATTGTVRLKAEFPNGELQQWPGQFVNVRLLIDTLRDAVVVPTAAVQRGPSGPFAYVVGDGDVAAMRELRVVQQDDAQAVIEAGVNAGDRVVTTGFTRLTAGARVAVSEAGPPAGNAPRGRGEGDLQSQRQRRNGEQGRTEGKSSSNP